MAERPRGTELIVAGDLNVELENMVGQGRDEEIAAVAAATAGLENLAGHLLQR